MTGLICERMVMGSMNQGLFAGQLKTDVLGGQPHLLPRLENWHVGSSHIFGDALSLNCSLLDVDALTPKPSHFPGTSV